MSREGRVFNLGQARVRLDPYAILAPPPTPQEVATRAAGAAAGCRIFVVDRLTALRIVPISSLPPAAAAALPPSYRAVETTAIPILELGVTVYAPDAESGAAAEERRSP